MELRECGARMRALTAAAALLHGACLLHAARAAAPELPPAWAPGANTPIPFDWWVPTLGGGNFTLTQDLPVIIHAYDPTDAFTTLMWTSKASLEEFAVKAPTDVHYLFLTYAKDAPGVMTALQGNLTAAIGASANLTAPARAALQAKLHFCSLPMTGISDVSGNWLSVLLGHWRADRATAWATVNGNTSLRLTRLPANIDWLPPAAANRSTPLAPFGDGCRDLKPYNVAGAAALVFREKATNCSNAQIIQAAQAANASSVLIAPPEGQDLALLDCAGAECHLPLNISANGIRRADALALRDLLTQQGPAAVRLKYMVESGLGQFAAVDELQRLQEVGWLRLPTLMHVGWAAQWLVYARGLRARLSRPALAIPIFANATLEGQHGVAATVQLPPTAEMDAYSRVELDFALGCNGTLDADCPEWDHVIQAFVCCKDAPLGGAKCETCDITPFASTVQSSSEAQAPQGEVQYPRRVPLAGAEQVKGCGREIQRWITPFRRRIGHWLSDVTPLRALLAGGECTFRVQTAPWSEPWQPSLSLRLSKAEAGPAAALVSLDPPGGDTPATPAATASPSSPTAGVEGLASQILPLYSGGVFDSSYNSRDLHPVISFPTPKGTVRALIQATITGHGSDENQCAEFCVTKHEFTVNGRTHSITFSDAGTDLGCTTNVLGGDIPNEHGTWQYGRDGWCDGQAVRPWVFDVTQDLRENKGAKGNTISYLGYYQNGTPQPASNPGFILMQSSLVLYTRNGTVPQAVEVYTGDAQ